MSSIKIEELKKKRQTDVKKKKSQIPFAICITFAVLCIYVMLFNLNFQYSMVWIIGILLGITLHKSRFCFAASFRDPIMVGNTSLLKAILIGLMVCTIGFFFIQYHSINTTADINLAKIPGQISPVGVHVIIGAILFGIGMVIAGGCASGTLMRIGEGFMMQIVVLAGFLIGTLMGARHYEFWDKNFISKSPTIYLPHYIGFVPALLLQLILLIAIYLLADWYDKKNNIMTDF